ncbi:hypothetical protein BA190_09405 [Labrys sp. WJW]|uniref:head decoration protein n=1 Tax=Labrys sp. WJW TaxID=1737983 RepID=UPI0008346267|nr:head decoration protein [Labrys sp. WJW]OCC05122.1 hypothetical protein BA190_09405 [Labrys sp. WJW]
MTVFTEGRHAAEFLVSEAAGYRSREAIIIGAGANLEAGTVLGFNGNGSATASAVDGNTGNGTISAVTVLTGALDGVYEVEFTSATAFTVTDPLGKTMAAGTAGTAYSDDVGFTITAGATAFVAGDGFHISVTAGGGKFVRLNPTANDGSQVAAGILYAPAFAADAEVHGVAFVRDCEVHHDEIVFPASITNDQRATAVAQLKMAGIILR